MLVRCAGNRFVYTGPDDPRDLADLLDLSVYMDAVQHRFPAGFPEDAPVLPEPGGAGGNSLRSEYDENRQGSCAGEVNSG